jgi:hypothetical protein
LGLGKEYFHGLISEVRIYDQALSEEEIFSHYAAKARVLGLPITTRVRQEGREMAKWTPPKTARQKGVRWLNNLVAELLSVTSEKGKREWTFTNPRDGWVFIASTARVRGKERLWLTLDEEPKEQAVIVHQSGQPETLEAMRYLKAGEHKIRLGKEGRPTLERLIVRAIPELIFCKFQYDPYVRPHGPYDWQFLKKHILPHVNCIVGSGADEHRPFVEEWKKQGKRWIVEVPATPYFKSQSADEAYRYWTECIGFKNQIYDGIIVDEFGGGDDQRYVAITESVSPPPPGRAIQGQGFLPLLRLNVWCKVERGVHQDSDGQRLALCLGAISSGTA